MSSQSNVSALGAFSFVEAAILLVAVAVVFLVWARSQKKGFHLPGGDGVAIILAGGWAMLLLVYRLFDKPDIQGAGATMGIQWGIFGAMLAAGALIAAGLRVKQIDAPEPPNPAADDAGWVAPPRRERERTPGPPPARRDRRHRVPARPPVVGGRYRRRANHAPRRSADDAPARGPVGGAHAPRTPPGAHRAVVGRRTTRPIGVQGFPRSADDR